MSCLPTMPWLSVGLQARFTGSSPTGLETIDVGMLLLLVIFIPWGGGRVLHIAQAGLRLMTLLTTCSD